MGLLRSTELGGGIPRRELCTDSSPPVNFPARDEIEKREKVKAFGCQLVHSFVLLSLLVVRKMAIYIYICMYVCMYVCTGVLHIIEWKGVRYWVGG